MYHTYILINQAKNRRYKGHSANLDARILRHNKGKTSSIKGDMWTVEYSEAYDNRVDAIKREKYFKTAAGRRWINKTLGNLNLSETSDLDSR